MPKPSLLKNSCWTIQLMKGRGYGSSYLSQWYESENEHNSTTGILTCLLWGFSPAC